MDGLIYAYHAPNSHAQRAYAEARLAQFATQPRQSQKSSSSEHTHDRDPDPSTWRNSHGQVKPRTSRTSLTKKALGLADHHPHKQSQTHYNNYDQRVSNMATIAAGSTGHSKRASRLLINDNTSINTMVATPSPVYAPNLHNFSKSPSTPLGRSKNRKTMDDELRERAEEILRNPFEMRHGRRYLRGMPYPLPCDLAELQRQNLRTLLQVTVLGGPICAPRWKNETPKKVLDMGCGTAYWCSLAHAHLAARGATQVEFVGMDVAHLASDLKKQGIRWKFVRHDIRKLPLPFEDGEFDLVMVKDLSIILPINKSTEGILVDIVRIIKDGGTFEVWDSDHTLRCMHPDIPPAPARSAEERAVAERTATFNLAPGHPFLPCQNKYLRKANEWIAEALDRRDILAVPCSTMGEIMKQEQGLSGLVARRVAIPLGELRWEKTKSKRRSYSTSHGLSLPMGSKERDFADPNMPGSVLTPDQAALRQTALMTVLQMTESMEPILKEVSGRNADEWETWWAGMMTDILDPSKASLAGECLEIGAWHATKVAVEEN